MKLIFVENLHKGSAPDAPGRAREARRIGGHQGRDQVHVVGLNARLLRLRSKALELVSYLFGVSTTPPKVHSNCCKITSAELRAE